MLTKYELQASLAREGQATTHIISKLKPEHLAFRFSPGQRSTQELMEYLAIQLEGSVAYFIQGEWARWETLKGEVAGLKTEKFAAAMDRQLSGVERLLTVVPDADYPTRMVKTPWGDSVPLATGLMEFTLKWAAAYKMQLFLQAKAAGLTTLASSNLWRGQDPQPKA